MNPALPSADRAAWLPAGLLAAAVHGAFLVFLLVGVNWQNQPSPAVQAELWSALPSALPPAPEVTPAPPPPPDVPVPAPEARPAPEAPASTRPAIVEEKVKPAKATPPKEDPHEAERQARQEEALRKLDVAAREAQKRVQAEEALRTLDQDLRADAARQAQGDAHARALLTASDRIRAKIRESTIVPPSVAAGVQCRVSFVLLPDGSVLEGSLHVLQASGTPTYDEAVQRAILAAQPLPMPDDVSLRRELRDIRLTFKNER